MIDMILPLLSNHSCLAIQLQLLLFGFACVTLSLLNKNHRKQVQWKIVFQQTCPSTSMIFIIYRIICFGFYWNFYGGHPFSRLGTTKLDRVPKWCVYHHPTKWTPNTTGTQTVLFGCVHWDRETRDLPQPGIHLPWSRLEVCLFKCINLSKPSCQKALSTRHEGFWKSDHLIP